MTSNQQEVRKREAKNAAREPGIMLPKALSKAAKEGREATMAAIAKLVDNGAAKNGGRVPKGIVPQVIQKFSKIAPGLTRDQINHYTKKHKRSATNGSDLTPGVDAHADEASLSAATFSNDLPQDDADPPEKRQKGGRPKGITMTTSRDELERYQKASAEAAREYKNALDDFAVHCRRNNKTGKRCLPKGKLNQIINEAKKRHNLEHLEIPKETIKSRIKRGSLAPSHSGLASPMERIEPTLVELCIRLGRARQPLKCKNFIPLVNSLLKGTLTEQEVIAFKARYCHGDENAKSAELGKGYYYGFLKRNGHKLVSKRGEKFAANRSDWSTYENLVSMYDGVYDEMVAAGVAKHLDEKVWMDIDGNIVDSKGKAYGKKVDTVLIHPDYVLFVDEVGNNTNQIGGAKPKEICSTEDAHFTVLGFTSANGEPVMCVIIFEGEQVKLEWSTGTEVQKISIGDKDDPDYFEANSGPGMVLPCGPTCNFRGKTVPCQCYASTKGSITSEILRNCLEKMDEVDLFPRTPDGPNPFLLLDGLRSQFELPFMEYIHQPETKWFVCIGVPYDIVPIINYGWERSFARTRTNKTAIAVRGWNPLNRALLEHPEIVETQKETAENQPMSQASAPDSVSQSTSTTTITS